MLKAVLDRPMFLDNTGNSLPSGIAAAIALLTSSAARLIVGLIGLSAVVLTGVATLALQWHRPSDVVASALLAIGEAAATHVTAAFHDGQARPASAARESQPVA